MTKSKRIAILLNGSIYLRQGLFNSVLNRTKHLIEYSNYEFEFILLSEYEPLIIRKLRGTKKVKTPRYINIDGVKFNINWRRFSLVDYILSIRLHWKPIFSNIYYNNFWKNLSQYDLIIAHSTRAGSIAMDAKRHYNIPFTVTWHGSDIHTLPFINSATMKVTKQIIKNADMNIFVSENLKMVSNDIFISDNKSVLYNGADERFHIYDESKKLFYKKKYKTNNKKIVTFVGNFIEVKNILIVPEIFRCIFKKQQDIIFWMLGDGKFMKQIQERTKDLPVVLWGNRPPEEIPDFLNCTDVQILPSLNEGLPLTMVEALKCGCHAVGSFVGGIPEVIGNENCIPLDDPNYIQHFADRVLYFLNEGKNDIQTVDDIFDWTKTAKKESEIINKYIK